MNSWLREAGRRPLLLVVDDELSVRDLVALVLEDAGYAIVVAGDGLEAIAAIEQRRPDLIVLDLMMPRLDGIGVVRWLRAQDLWPAVPVVIVSAGADVARVARDFGLRYHLPKPFDLDELLDIVAGALGEQDATQAQSRSSS
jgi:CheY-like chemotaxis protein